MRWCCNHCVVFSTIISYKHLNISIFLGLPHLKIFIRTPRKAMLEAKWEWQSQRRSGPRWALSATDMGIDAFAIVGMSENGVYPQL
jgi:hypothetical protein